VRILKDTDWVIGGTAGAAAQLGNKAHHSSVPDEKVGDRSKSKRESEILLIRSSSLLLDLDQLAQALQRLIQRINVNVYQR
jgi:hypothetical protein